MGNIYVSQILINGGSSCDIMYLELYEKTSLDKGILCPYEDSYLHAFNGTNIRP